MLGLCADLTGGGDRLRRQCRLLPPDNGKASEKSQKNPLLASVGGSQSMLVENCISVTETLPTKI